MSTHSPETPSEGTPPAPAPHGPSPRALRTMAIVRWILLGLVTVLAVTTVVTIWGPSKTEQKAPQAARYYCPMHPQIRSPEPGECPICHMDLVPTTDEHEGQHDGHEHGTQESPASVTSVVLSEEKQRAVGIATTLVEDAALGDRLRVPGVLSAPETGRSEVRVRAPGFVEQVAVRQTGVRVSGGQPLAFVYSPDIYRAQEEFIAISRWNAGAPSGGSPGTSDLAAAARRGLELLGLSPADLDQIARTGQPIRAIAVRAPASGFVTRTNAILGSRTGPEMVLYEIADLSKLWVIASVHERDLPSVHPGTQARFAVAGSSGEPLVGKVDLVEPLLDEATRTTRVRLVIDNQGASLRPGQFGDVEFDLPAARGLFVPRDAVIRTGQHDYVYVLSPPDRFEPRVVTVGSAREGRVQIVSGIVAGERVVSRGSFMLDSESRLKASLRAAPVEAGGSKAPPTPEHVH